MGQLLFGVDFNQFHGLLDLELLKVEESTADFTATLVVSLRYKLMGPDIVLFKSERVLFVKLFKKILCLKFVLFLNALRCFVTTMQCHELIFFQKVFIRLLSINGDDSMQRREILHFVMSRLFESGFVVSPESVEPVVEEDLFLVGDRVFEGKRRLGEVAVTFIVKLKIY